MNLHAESGRPFLFTVQRDYALDHGDAAGMEAATRRMGLWERSPEEWEAQRPVGTSRQRRLQNFVDGVFSLQTPGGAIEVVPSQHLSGSDSYLIADQLFLGQTRYQELLRATALRGEAATVTFDGRVSS